MADDPGGLSSVAIVGATGALGHGLALRCGRSGLRVGLGSREAARAQAALVGALEECPKGSFFAGENKAIAPQGEIVILCVPFAMQVGALRDLKDSWRPGQIMLDTTVPLATSVGGKPHRLIGVWQGSAAEQAAEMVPASVRVVSGLHTVSAAHLADASYTFEEDTLLCGDDLAAIERVADLIRRVPGLRPIHVGPLEMSRVTEALTPMLIATNRRYSATVGIRIANLA